MVLLDCITQALAAVTEVTRVIEIKRESEAHCAKAEMKWRIQQLCANI